MAGAIACVLVGAADAVCGRARDADAAGDRVDADVPGEDVGPGGGVGRYRREVGADGCRVAEWRDGGDLCRPREVRRALPQGALSVRAAVWRALPDRRSCGRLRPLRS